MSGTDPLSPLPFGADGGAPKDAGAPRRGGQKIRTEPEKDGHQYVF